MLVGLEVRRCRWHAPSRAGVLTSSGSRFQGQSPQPLPWPGLGQELPLPGTSVEPAPPSGLSGLSQGVSSQVQLTVASLAVRMHLSVLHAENWSGVLLGHIRPFIIFLCRQVQKAGKSHPVLSKGTDTQDLGNKRTDAGCWSYAPPKRLKGERDS